MGVRGLHGFVGSSCPQVCTEVNFRELAEQHRSEHPGRAPTIVVDAMCCLRYWYTPESWVCGGQWKEYFSVLEDFVRTFTAAGIRLVFFFDGMVEQDKRDEWVRRRLKNSREIARIFRYLRAHGEQPGRSMFFIPSGLAIFTRFALKTLGQDTMCSLQEADYEVAAYGRQNGCLGILGEDTDYLIYDTCPYFSIGELCLDSLTTIMLCRQKLCASLGLGLPDLPLLACLLGNDIVPEGTFETFRYKCLSSYTSVRENCDKKGSVVFAVADHISKVLRLHRGQKSPWIPQTPKAVTTLDKQEVPMSSDPESKQEVPVNLEPEIKQQVTMVSDTEILEVARARHVQAESYLVYSVLTSGEVECSNTLEDALDQALPSQAFVYRPVRQRVYALLLADSQGGAGSCPAVREWFVYAGNPLRHPDLVRPLQMNLPGGTPSLRQLWLSQEPGVQAQRVDVLLACLDLAASREELQALESPFRTLCCLLIYLFMQVDALCLEDLHAFVAQALCLQGKSAGQLADLQLDHVDPRAVQLGSLLVRGLTTLVLVNSACGFPWRTSELMPWNVFDGKLFHEKYLQSARGCSAEALVEQNRSRLARFHQLKSVVCKACLGEGRRIVSQQLWRPHHTGRWGRQGPGSHRMSSGHSRSSQGQYWRDQGPGSRHHESDPWRRHAPSSGWSN
ncbi:constitutive coactivator of peroxisome proliferator-activated receptor gamma isoform X2 [Phyllostomus hastatus]|uniref:constitutive coactivator of peroxisome proliferator-activated receptor gamma isoform X2 n=1 Tax=Phyllostomus hastatus TaxID=9423 RepID=UPI001E6847C9|nr:constitutive coactivator of peroxisome proliferator-activated receptor gamma isoform X2 [Phyllostomus hastatus]